MNVLVVTPTYNERDNLPLLAAGVLKHDGYRLLVVDDGSPDGTGAVADELAKANPGRVEVMHRAGPRGLGRSYVDGLLHAITEGRADFICQMDCDLSHDPEYLPALVSAAAANDLVIGSRYMNGGVSVVNWPVHRILLSALGNRYIRFVTNLAASDCTSGYRCWRRDVLASLPVDHIFSDGYSFLVEMLAGTEERGYRVTEVPITFVERRQGESKLSAAVLLESVITPWRLAATRGRGR